MSTHSISVVEIAEVLPHPNADALELTHIGGWQCVIAKGQFKPNDKAIYVEPDYVVPTSRPEFAFLDKKSRGLPHRLKAVRLRGEISFGLLIPMPEHLSGAPVGANVMEELGIVRYEPPVSGRGGNFSRPAGPAPTIPVPKFDLENVERYEHLFDHGEYVYVTEKLHGTNARFMYWDDKVWVGSRNQWSNEPDDGDKKSWWWTTYLKYPEIDAYIKANPGHVLYGEIYGDVQELKYGMKQGELRFAAFGIYDATTGKWFDYNDLRARCDSLGIERAPLVYEGSYHMGKIREIAEEDSKAAELRGHKQMSEGVVIIPQQERINPRHGRVALKYISRRYWLS